jgi:NADH:ubiquinone oxidoreductase subunit 5 (subunit L)/multisubunit Na+/H+ antiporter MnhA subunit
MFSVEHVLKSAQLFLHTCYLTQWKVLPVSALLHAATMLQLAFIFCRCSPLLENSQNTLTLFFNSACTAFLQLLLVFQNDLKRIIAFNM